MRVLVVCDWFLKYAASQSAALRRAGVGVVLLCRDHAAEFGGSSDERQSVLDELDGVEVRALPGRISSLASLRDVRRLRGIVKAWRPDVVHAHDNTDPRLLWIVHGCPRVTTVHDPQPHPGQHQPSAVERRVRRQWIAGSEAVVVHGRQLVDELPAWARSKRVAVVGHGAPVREHPLPRPARATVLLFGRLEPYKGIEVLLPAMELVWQTRPDVRLLVAGRGPEAAIVPAHPNIELRAEYVPEEALDDLFGEATLAILPYTEASQTGVGSYALGRGVPLIVTDVGALPEVALDPSFVVPPGDPAALADAILAHLDHDVATRDAALSFARARLSWDACAAATLELYESVRRTEAA